MGAAKARLDGVDAVRIVERASGWEGGEHNLHLDEAVPARAVAFFADMVDRRSAGEPLQYVVGRWGFRSLDLLVDRRVLIPRPETEVVAGIAIEEAQRTGARVAVDLGTGSGAIALSLAVEVTGLRVWGTDVSPDALAVARANLAGVGGYSAQRVTLAQGSWYEALPALLAGHVDVLVSNPPYVSAAEDLPAVVRDWEPVGALVSGPSGMEAIDLVVRGAPSWLSPIGVLVVELAPHQARDAEGLARTSGFTAVEIRRDLAGRERVLLARS